MRTINQLLNLLELEDFQEKKVEITGNIEQILKEMKMNMSIHFQYSN